MSSSHRGKFITFEGLDGTGKSTQILKLAKALRARGQSVVVTREPGGTGTGEKIRDVILDSATTGLAPMAEMALMFASRAQHIHEVILPAVAQGKIVLCDRFTDSTEAYQGNGRKLGSKPVLELHRILCQDLQPDLTILMFASRAQHINEIILPALAQGKIVLCDRFTDSTEAYQGSGRKLGSKPVLELHRILCLDLQPDLTILMDSDVATSVERARRRNVAQVAKAGRLHKDENRFEQENRAFFARVRHGYAVIARREAQRVVTVDARGTPSQTHAKILDLVSRKLRLSAKD